MKIEPRIKKIPLKPTFEPWRPIQDKKAVAVLMSGGVDSSVTALLLKNAGWDVVGITLKIPPVVEDLVNPRPCCGAGASLVCRHLDIPHYFMYVQEDFIRLVVEPFQKAYSEGLTPSPCVDCNTFVKFGIAWDVIEERLGISHVATGHYARVLQGGNGAVLARGGDAFRDQSYFLYGIPPERLKSFLLPLGEKSKDEVRLIARENRLDVAEKPDSMELCFAGEGDYRLALTSGGPRTGPILDETGRELGRHGGIESFTVGQRRGLGISSRNPLYIVGIDARNNTLVAGPRSQVEKTVVEADRVNILLPEALQDRSRLFGRIRSSAPLQPCTVTMIQGKKLQTVFEKPVFAPAPGQHLVLYSDSGHVVGGGVIK